MNELNTGNHAVASKTIVHQKEIKVERTARYYVIGDPKNEIETYWFTCHGYGQLAEHFVNRFGILEGQKQMVIAPEALSRYYMRGVYGKVGASWMTKEDRLNEIEDYVNYLDSLYAKVIMENSGKKPTINILGFSQGCATVGRWICQGKVKADNLVIWAGEIPPDLDYDRLKEVSVHTNIFLVYGKFDPYFSSTTVKAEQAKLKERDIPFQTLFYNGKHEITEMVLQELKFMCS